MHKGPDPVEQRTRVVVAAWKVILDEGLDAATMRRIAARADCTTGLVTHYFKNKEDVLLMLVRHIARLTGERIAAAQAGRSGLDAVRAVLMESTAVTQEHADEWRIWVALWDYALSNPRLHAEWTKSSNFWRAGVRQGLVRAIDHGELSQEAPVEQIIEALAAFHYGLSLSVVLAPDRAPGTRIVEALDQQLLLIASTYSARRLD